MKNKTIKILMINDNQENMTILKDLIIEAFPDAVVLSALNGQKGLEIAAKEDPILFFSILLCRKWTGMRCVEN